MTFTRRHSAAAPAKNATLRSSTGVTRFPQNFWVSWQNTWGFQANRRSWIAPKPARLRPKRLQA